MNESGLRDRLKKELAKTGWYYQKISDRFTAGIPDFILCVNGRFVCIELKVDDRKMTPLQNHIKDQIEFNKGLYLCITYKNQFKVLEVECLQKRCVYIGIAEVITMIRSLCEGQSQSWGLSNTQTGV